MSKRTFKILQELFHKILPAIGAHNVQVTEYHERASDYYEYSQ